MVVWNVEMLWNVPSLSAVYFVSQCLHPAMVDFFLDTFLYYMQALRKDLASFYYNYVDFFLYMQFTTRDNLKIKAHTVLLPRWESKHSTYVNAGLYQHMYLAISNIHSTATVTTSCMAMGHHNVKV